MAQQIINRGSSSNAGDGDTLRGGALKINDNFTELYNQSPASSHSFDTLATAQASTSIVAGETFSTAGRSIPGDGGGAYYTSTATDLSSTENAGSIVSLANTLYATANFGGTVTPVHFGAVINDDTYATSNVVAINNMFVFVRNEPIGRPAPYISFPSGTYYIDDTLELPIKQGESRTYFVDLRGSIIKMTISGSTGWLMSRTHPDPTSATDTGVDYMGGRVVITNGEFHGNGTGGALEVTCTYNSVISNVYFRDCLTGISLRFCLNALVDHCWGNTFRKGVTMQGGDWTAATATNSQCNVSRAVACRFYCADDSLGVGTSHAIQIIDSNMCQILDCIIEGLQPSYAIHYEASNTTVQKLTIKGLHLEVPGGCLTSAIFIDGALGGEVDIIDVYQQYAETPLINATTSVQYCNINYFPVYFTTGSTFATNLSGAGNAGVTWRFGSKVPVGVLTDAATYWVGDGGADDGLPYYKNHYKTLVTDETAGSTSFWYPRSDGTKASEFIMGYQKINLFAHQLGLSPDIFNSGLSGTTEKKMHVTWTDPVTGSESGYIVVTQDGT
jgi:hypothetical protein